ncbi:MAG: hypothetical protein M1836_007628 [Candelina mexicana]|nr:MAG: hypothetical protein M1836_007628 [Candelina mexicana]
MASTNEVDLRLLDYVSSFDKNLMCPICHCPFINGIRLDCDHIFCKKCIDQALESQSKPINDCPSCRTNVNFKAAQRAPRAIVQMVDELKALCPHHKEGCQAILARVDVQDHIDKYCAWTEVKCSAQDCHLAVLRKDASRGCLHSTVSCTDCNMDLMEKDLEVHQFVHCKQRKLQCPDCGSEITRREVLAHSLGCLEAIRPCTGVLYGCTYQSKRAELDEHLKTCSLAALAPFLKAQNDRLSLQEASIEHLRRKNDILEGGLSSVQAALNSSNEQVSSALFSSAQPTASASPTSPHTTAPAETPAFDSATHYLLLLHESLREEVGRVSTAVSDLDAKSSMMIINEGLRMKDDMAHTTAAINSLRMQMHWLVSSRLHGQPRPAGGPSFGGPSNAQRPVVAPSNSTGWNTNSLGAPAPEPIRRSSSSNTSSTMIGDIPRL